MLYQLSYRPLLIPCHVDSDVKSAYHTAPLAYFAKGSSVRLVITRSINPYSSACGGSMI
jgi:hypothetical protein